MATQRYDAGSQQTLVSAGGALTSGSAVLNSGTYDNGNSSNLYFWGDVELYAPGFGGTPTAGKVIELYLVPSYDGGTTYQDADTTTPPAGLYAGAFVVRGTSGAQRLTLRGVPLPPVIFKTLVNNKTDQQLSANWTLKVTPYRTQSA